MTKLEHDTGRSNAHPGRRRKGAALHPESMTRYLDRRAFIRVPVSGVARWQCENRTGECQFVDISPGGAALRFPARRAPSIGQCVEVSVPLEDGLTWRLPRDARVVRRTLCDDGWHAVGLQFSPDDWSP
ncbi:MAG: PilZ domain-containing protein [Phycisphaerales bacterium]|nr:PilZ domain-containing protein [Phycisphaerales bacterium]